MSMETRALGDAIRAARMKKGLTQDALSELLDITPTHLKNIEGSRRKPSVPLLFQMMELLDLSVDALVFQSREESRCLRMDGLSEREAEALERLVDAMREKWSTGLGVGLSRCSCSGKCSEGERDDGGDQHWDG